MSLVEQELLNLPEHLSLPPVFSGVRVTRSLVLCVCFVDRCLSFCPFSFGHWHCVVCFSSIYGFWLPLWYLQTLLIIWINVYRYYCFMYILKYRYVRISDKRYKSTMNLFLRLMQKCALVPRLSTNIISMFLLQKIVLVLFH